MPFSTIDSPKKYFDTSLYTGTGSSQSISNLNFQPDFTWIKGRSGATDHALYDAVRGVQKDLVSNATSAETTQTTGLTAFGSTGFTIGALAKLNTSSATYCSWNWLGANTTVSNTAGTITSTVSANTTSGFSIVSYTSQSSGSATIGHGLGAVPKIIICKIKDQSDNWRMYHSSLGNTGFMILNLSNAFSTNSTTWNNTSPTSTVFTLGTQWAASYNMITYCFAEVKGYSKIGSYTGNGSTDGTFIYTGFKPSFIMFKRSDAVQDWYMYDNKRNTYNPENLQLDAMDVGAESTLLSGDFVSNGFKFRSLSSAFNTSGGTYIYMAFAENPFTSSKGIPCTAR